MLFGVNLFKAVMLFTMVSIQLKNVCGLDGNDKYKVDQIVKRFQDDVLMGGMFVYHVENFLKHLLSATENINDPETGLRFKEIIKGMAQKRIQKEKSENFWKLRQG